MGRHHTEGFNGAKALLQELYKDCGKLGRGRPCLSGKGDRHGRMLHPQHPRELRIGGIMRGGKLESNIPDSGKFYIYSRERRSI